MTDYKEMLKLLSVEADAEGAVLLENDGMLPLAPGDRLAVFGRGQFVHYKSGTGSGGKVNVEYSTSLYDGLKSLGADVNDELADVYRAWLADNPYDAGDGWKEPWAQREMPVSAELAARAAEKSDKAVIIIGRTAGEDRDNINEQGSYLLTDTEYEMIKNVSDAFGAVCVLLNTGNIIDMKWSREIKLSAIMYIWHGGQEGGRAAAELLCGRRFPSGHLADTIAYNIEDYPSYDGFANNDEQVYSEDIYVGYRYFETFAPDAVLYPFGFGRSYTDFDLKISRAECCGDYISIEVSVKNIGCFAGKEVVQVYCGAEGTVLARPVRELVGFAKTDTLQPGEDAALKINVCLSDIARYDDTGATGRRSCFVLDAGRYSFFVGTNVRDAAKVLEYEQTQTAAVKQLSPVMQPAGGFARLTNNNGLPAYETVTPAERRENEPPADAPYTGDRGIKLADVYYGRASLDDFAAQLSDFDLACLSQGEGMNSPKVRAGTGGAIGGLTLSLQRFGIPAVCVTDGPSGLRFDNGDRATCIPNGTLICCTWNRELARRLYMYEGMEARANDVDALLGPGINIHRLPLCGRNFEYMSEDPLLAGSIAAQICRGLKDGGITATVKHFAANNKEQNRKKINMVISERALREIYLKPFELAVKSGAVDMVMTAYNMINGVFCASNYELNTTVLRGEWGYDGLVMTDWWPNTAKIASGGFDADRIQPIIAQNDVFMVNDSAADTAYKMLENAENLRGALFRNAKNILRAVMKTPAFEKSLSGAAEIPQGAERGRGKVFFEIKDIRCGAEYEVNAGESADYACAVAYRAQSPDTVQIPVDIFVNGERYVCMLRGTEGARENKILQIPLAAGQNKIRIDNFKKRVEIISIVLYNAK